MGTWGLASITVDGRPIALSPELPFSNIPTGPMTDLIWTPKADVERSEEQGVLELAGSGLVMKSSRFAD